MTVRAERFQKDIDMLSRQELKMKDDQRKKLKEVIGVLKKKVGRGDLPGPIIAVGDVTVNTLHSLGSDVRVAVCDLRTRRGRPDEFSSLPDELSNYERVDLDNPPARISIDAWTVLEHAIDAAAAGGKKTLVVVKGEEDLLSLPAIALAPEDWTVAYGAPDLGMHIVKCDEKAKELTIKVLEDMTHET